MKRIDWVEAINELFAVDMSIAGTSKKHRRCKHATLVHLQLGVEIIGMGKRKG
jgi:hypothetical protein